MRIWPLIALGVFAGIAGGISARIFSGGALNWPEPSTELITVLRKQPPPQPPSRDEIARFVPDQRAELVRANGDPIAVEYSSVILDPRWIDLEFSEVGTGNSKPMRIPRPCFFSPAQPSKSSSAGGNWIWLSMAI